MFELSEQDPSLYTAPPFLCSITDDGGGGRTLAESHACHSPA